jgi:hypothetical protein
MGRLEGSSILCLMEFRMLRAQRTTISRALDAARNAVWSAGLGLRAKKLICSWREDTGTGAEVRKGSM